jgi:hypothetical protein
MSVEAMKAVFVAAIVVGAIRGVKDTLRKMKEAEQGRRSSRPRSRRSRS